LLEARCGDTAAARELFQAGLALQPANQQLLHASAQLERARRRPQEARALLSTLLAGHPRNGHAWATLGRMEEEAGCPDAAAAAYAEGMRCPPTAGGLLSFEAAAVLAEAAGQRASARALFAGGAERGGAAKPRARLLREWASFEKRAGDLEAAGALFAEAAAAAPSDERTWLQWGLLERRRGDLARARECFRRGVAAAPRDPYLYQSWALLEARTGQACGCCVGVGSRGQVREARN